MIIVIIVIVIILITIIVDCRQRGGQRIVGRNVSTYGVRQGAEMKLRSLNGEGATANLRAYLTQS